MDQGADRYVISNVGPYDQKNEMFKRPLWDSQMKAVGDKFYFTPMMPKDKPGYRHHDQSMVNATWRLDEEFGKGVRGGHRFGLLSNGF
jgi:hypothetical protein